MSELESQKLLDLLVKYMRDELSAEENNRLQEWLIVPGNTEIFEGLIHDDSLWVELKQDHLRRKRILAAVKSSSKSQQPDRRKNELKRVDNRVIMIRRWSWVAAMIVIPLLVSVYFWHTPNRTGPEKTKTIASSANDVSPGGNKATLILANGSSVVLDSVKNGTISVNQGENIAKTEDGKLAYKAVTGNLQNQLPEGTAYNILSTPRGGQYFVELSDGTRVWLNAASSLRYPVKFSSKERVVELSGEGYFEVASKPAKTATGKLPFIVKLTPRAGEKDQAQIEVLGTHFNVNNYPDEGEIRATLLEGKIDVSIGDQHSVIHPGQQAQIAVNKKIKVIDDADTDEAVSWKNGITSFKNENIKGIMRKVSRWYDVDVVYEGNVPEWTFMGGIPRSSNLSEILRILKLNKINFELTEGNKKIIVKPE